MGLGGVLLEEGGGGLLLPHEEQPARASGSNRTIGARRIGFLRIR